jgi:hypothetical protein
MCVQSTFWKKPDGRWIVHLWNGLNTSSDHGLQEAEVPLREEAIEIHGMELHIRGLDFRSAHCEPQGIALQPIKRDGVTILEVPPVAIHSAIVIEP